MLRFTVEHRSNGLSFVTVEDNGQQAGTFAGARADVAPVLEAIAQAAPVEEIGPAAIVRRFAPSMLSFIGLEPGPLPANYRRPASAQPIAQPRQGEQAIRALLWFIAACQRRGADLTGYQFDYWEEPVVYVAPGQPDKDRAWTATKLYAIAPDGTPWFACSPDEITSAAKAHTPAVSFLEAAGIEADTQTAYFD